MSEATENSNGGTRHFPLTTGGYSAAKKWLQEIGEWERVSTTGLSVDGWSITEAANRLYNKGEL